MLDTENGWRMAVCPNMEPLFCDCPYIKCADSWDCSDVE